ncbi:MAG: hypothetical protein DMF87_08030 [Acidobacteria bacterium]|nr:MAG: hypothetical protein DMF88_22155 [Acidobacteriota bacterium]PYR80756.1 MAG: hypothetical protein DMF87_08030 [Acidobacteriota bacterium]
MPAKRYVIKSDLKRVDRVREERIDYSDIPELDDDVFKQPLVEWPPRKETITIRVDADVLDWFKSEGSGYQTRMNRVLRHYMQASDRSHLQKTTTRRRSKLRGAKRR